MTEKFEEIEMNVEWKDLSNSELQAVVESLNLEIESRLNKVDNPPLKDEVVSKAYKKKAKKIIDEAYALEGEYDIKLTVPISIKMKVSLKPSVLDEYLTGQFGEFYDMEHRMFNIGFDILVDNTMKAADRKLWQEYLEDYLDVDFLLQFMGDAKKKIMSITNRSDTLVKSLTPEDKIYLKQNPNFLK